MNHGKPPVAATSSPGEFTGKNVVPACGAATGNSVAHTRAVPSHSGKSKATAEKAALARANESAVTEKRAPATQPSEKATTERSSAAHTSRNTETDKHAAATHPSESKATTEKAAATYPSRNTETEKHAAATHPTESKATTESASWRGGYEHEIGDFPQLPQKRHPERSASRIYRVTQRLWARSRRTSRMLILALLLRAFQPPKPASRGEPPRSFPRGREQEPLHLAVFRRLHLRCANPVLWLRCSKRYQQHG